MSDQNITRESPATPAPQAADHAKKHFFRASAADFKKIPGSPIAYWIKKGIISIFSHSKPLSCVAEIGKGLDTGNNNKFLRQWFEVCLTSPKWIPCQKGGPFRKWFGNNDFFINWENDGEEIKAFKGSNIRNSHRYLRKGISWTRISSSSTAFRFFPEGQIFESTGPCLFLNHIPLNSMLALLNSCVTKKILTFIAPTLDFQSGHISKLPLIDFDWDSKQLTENSSGCIVFEKNDWDSYETSWDFGELPLLRAEFKQGSLEQTYAIVREHWKQMCLEMKRLEEENNRIFIEAYGLQDELTPEVPWREITLACNPYYRYSKKAEASEDADEAPSENDDEPGETESFGEVEDDNSGDAGAEFPFDAGLEERLLGDTMRELISYAVGCMFGRYSLDKPGLILADQGQGNEDYLQQVPEPCFMPDSDNVLPVLEEEYFIDDIAERFKKFIKIAFGEASYQKNLEFIEKALGKDIRRYFFKDFYNDHVKRYKKRPIYWLFASPNGSFNALIYMHRYRHDTPSQVLNHYLRVYIEKINTRNRDLEQVKISATASPRDQNQAAKEIDKNKKILRELEIYEREIVFPLAARRLEIDLDNGVKQNYPLFGKALKKITGI